MVPCRSKYLILEFKRSIDLGEVWSLFMFWQERTKSPFWRHSNHSLEGPLGGNPGASALGGRLLGGGLCASHGTLVNQSSNSMPAITVTQASGGFSLTL